MHDALALQPDLVEHRKRGEIPDQLLIVEHPHVVTMGRNGHMENVLASPEILERAGIELHHTDRGGDVTYHGPGQIVGYPIFDLREWKRDVVAYVRALEQVLIEALAEFGIAAGRDAGRHRRLGGRREGRRHRRAYQPLGDVPRLRAESRYGFGLFPVHRAVRFDPAGDFDAGTWVSRRAATGSRVVAQIARRLRRDVFGRAIMEKE